ncbi:MAG: AbrB/MazE/SpoVT family DNA-binding domain-containing protein [Deltaproteobacteria bacterium]|nr:AbrB/MazE/SpoVT family DNA-binding domain-containing protein [Deltaproteobacteria bacterium]
MLSKVFDKGQIVIPATLRRKFGIHAHSDVDVVDCGNYIKIVPVKTKNVMELAGIFASKSKPSKQDIEDAIAEGYLESWKK